MRQSNFPEYMQCVFDDLVDTLLFQQYYHNKNGCKSVERLFAHLNIVLSTELFYFKKSMQL